MDTAGWTGLVLDRCPICHGIFVDVREIAQLEHEPAPDSAMSDAHRLKVVLIDAGWATLTAKAIAVLVMRFLL